LSVKRPRITWEFFLVTAVAVACSVVAGTAEPFTWRADLVTAAGIVLVLAAALAARLLGKRRRLVGAAPPVVDRADRKVAALPRRTGLAWGGLAVVVVAFELANFALLPRHEHPTISSLLDVLTSHEVLRGLVFAAWIGAGLWLVGPLGQDA
jgi:hypothetical protein